VHAVRTGNLLFLAGKGVHETIGKVGAEVSKQAYEIAAPGRVSMGAGSLPYQIPIEIGAVIEVKD
jgi:hypothetical protein